MSIETLGSSEKKVETGVSVLEKMPKFDPEQAKENVEKAKEELGKKAETEKPKFDARTQGLQVIAEKPKVTPVEELSEKDAAQEYLDILMDLSAGFTSPEGKASRAVARESDGTEKIINRGYSGDRTVVESLLEKSSSKEELQAIKDKDDEAFKKGEIGNPEGLVSMSPYLDRAHSLTLAENILKAESMWRSGGEMFDQQKYDTAKAELEEFKDKDHKKFFLVKLFTGGKRKRELARLEANFEEAQRGQKQTENANRMLQTALSNAYDEEYSYGHHSEDYNTTQEEREKRNNDFNEKFFSKENQEKIERAIALRKKLFGGGDK